MLRTCNLQCVAYAALCERVMVATALAYWNGQYSLIADSVVIVIWG